MDVTLRGKREIFVRDGITALLQKLQKLKDGDKPIWFCLLGLTACSLAALSGVAHCFLPSWRTVLVQAAAAVLGFLALGVLSCLDYRRLSSLWAFYTPAAVSLVLLTFLFGYSRAGSDDRAWLPVFGTGFTFQPTEFLKPVFLLNFSLHLSRVKKDMNRPLAVALLLLHALAAPLLIHFQGDDGTALVFALVAAVMLIGAGLSERWIALFGGICTICLPLGWAFVLHEDQRLRILSLFSQGEELAAISYQQVQSLAALRNGGLFGIGLFSPGHTYVPEARNDFILSFIGESAGLLGILFVLALLVLLCFRLARLAYLAKRAKNPQGFLLCLGVLSLIVVQAAMNIGMCFRLLPVIGLNLPFLSAGGSSLLSSFCAMGLAQSVCIHKNPKPLTTTV